MKMSEQAIAENTNLDAPVGWSRSMAERAAQSIALAHAINPNSWCINLADGMPFVVVGPQNILSLDGILLVTDEAFDHLNVEELQGVSDTGRQFKENPWSRYLKVQAPQNHENLGVLTPFHEEAVIRLVRKVRTKSTRWRWHVDDYRIQINEVYGLDIPEPAFLEELRRILSTEESSGSNVRQSVGSGLATPDPTPEAARQMARTIIAAHAISPTCWAVYVTNNRIAIMVGNVTVGGSAVPGRYDFVVRRDALPDEVIKSLDTQQVSKIPKDYADLSFPRLSDVTTDEQFADFADAHVVALSRVTNPYKRAVLWQNHDDALRKRIEEVSGVALPHPGYLNQPLEQSTTGESLSVAKQAVVIGPTKNHTRRSTIRRQFGLGGLHYTEDQIAAFYTALQTKGFVVLSGISGTGKSKIATGFVDMLPVLSSTQLPVVDSSGTIPISIKPYMRTYKRVILPSRQVDLLPPLEVGSQREISITLDGRSGEGRIEHRAHSAGSSIMVVYFKGEIGRAVANLELGTRLYFRPVIDDDGDAIKQIDLLRESDLRDDSIPGNVKVSTPNHLFLSVRPDWRDSTSLLGYYNPLTQTYEWTDFLMFLIRAGENYKGPEAYRIAWFVILDEMNLAHVEYYFADLLSVIESGRDEKGWTTEPLRLTYPDALDDEAPPRELFLPPNLYIIGTVNMDETTHAFSPKVLDRAFTIELTDVDFRGYPLSGAALDGSGVDDATKASILAAFSRGGKFARIDKQEIWDLIERRPVVRDHLQALNDVLRPFRMHFGYRVFDEVTQYLGNNDINEMVSFEEAFDQAVFMKVLPKFSGSRARLQSPLHGVLAWAIDPARTGRDDVENATKRLLLYERGEAPEAWEVEPTFPRVAERVRDMLVALERDGFVSFG
jgi:hypothetical protein